MLTLGDLIGHVFWPTCLLTPNHNMFLYSDPHHHLPQVTVSQPSLCVLPHMFRRHAGPPPIPQPRQSVPEYKPQPRCSSSRDLGSSGVPNL